MYGENDPRTAVRRPIERRRFPRITILSQVQSRFVSLDVPVETFDIGAGGFAIKSPVAFTEGDVHEFMLTRDDGVSMLVTARAAHSRPAPGPAGGQTYLSGWEFVLDDERTRRAVAALIEHLQSVPDVL